MSSIVKSILVIVAEIVVLLYTINNYLSGKVGISFLIVALLLVGCTTVGIVNGLIQELKNK